MNASDKRAMASHDMPWWMFSISSIYGNFAEIKKLRRNPMMGVLCECPHTATPLEGSMTIDAIPYSRKGELWSVSERLATLEEREKGTNGLSVLDLVFEPIHFSPLVYEEARTFAVALNDAGAALDANRQYSKMLQPLLWEESCHIQTGRESVFVGRAPMSSDDARAIADALVGGLASRAA
jgi:hypothetical protein